MLRAPLVAVAASVALAAVKLVSGVVGHSYALIADGVESLLDVFGSLVVWTGLRIAVIPPDDNHPYGHGRAESMAGLIVALTLIGSAVLLSIQSVREILTPHHGPAPFTLAVLVMVIVVKELLYKRLSRIGHESNSLALRADAWHQRSDALTSVAAFVGISVALIGGAGFEAADDWAALFACCVIAYNGIHLVRLATAEMMDVVAPPEIEIRVRELAAAVPEVLELDKCFVRKSGPHWLVEIHVVVDGGISVDRGHAIGHQVKDVLRDASIGVLDVAVHIEPGKAPAVPTADPR